MSHISLYIKAGMVLREIMSENALLAGRTGGPLSPATAVFMTNSYGILANGISYFSIFEVMIRLRVRKRKTAVCYVFTYTYIHTFIHTYIRVHTYRGAGIAQSV
jgi:hypothetical protein